MKTTFVVSDTSYNAEIRRAEKLDGEKFVLFEVEVRGPDQIPIQGSLKLTEEAVEVAARESTERGGSADDWLAQGCGRALAAELVIRKLKANFSFIVDHRWMTIPPL